MTTQPDEQRTEMLADARDLAIAIRRRLSTDPNAGGTSIWSHLPMDDLKWFAAHGVDLARAVLQLTGDEQPST